MPPPAVDRKRKAVNDEPVSLSKQKKTVSGKATSLDAKPQSLKTKEEKEVLFNQHLLNSGITYNILIKKG